jgi:hypothetical protein
MSVEPADNSSTQSTTKASHWKVEQEFPGAFNGCNLLQTISDDDRVIRNHKLQFHPKSSWIF